MRRKDKEAVLALIAKIGGAPSVEEKALFGKDVNVDSLGKVTLLLQLEETFGFELSEDDMNPFGLRGAQDVLALVEKHLSAKT